MKDYKEYMKKTYNVDPAFESQSQETDLDFRTALLKIKALGVDVLAIGGQIDAIARITQQALEVGLPARVRRVSASAASQAPVPELAGDAVVGLIYAAAFNCNDERPAAQAFVKLVQDKYKVRCPDHDFSQAYDTAQIVKAALKNATMLVLLPEAGQETACQLTPDAVPVLPVRPRAAAAGRLRSRCPDSGQVAHSSTTVATIDFPWKVICTHMPQ